MQRTLIALTPLLMGSMTGLFAEEDILPETYKRKGQGMEASGIVSPPSRFQVEDGWNIFLNGEFLWWVAQEDDLFYVQGGSEGTTIANPPDGSVNYEGHLKKIDPHWKPGFRAGIGGNMPYDEWDIFLSWTYYHSHAQDFAHGSLIALWAHPDVIGATPVHSAKASWHLNYNLLDLELGRSFWVGKHLSIRPFFGGRAAWIDQALKIRYRFNIAPEITTKTRVENDFEGGGIRAGLDTRFALLHGWSFYGLASFSLLYGHFDCDFHLKENHILVAKSDDDFHNGISNSQLAFGIRWDTYFSRLRYHLGLYAGWEQNIWFGINKMNRFDQNLQMGSLEKNNGNLSLQGGTFGARFDF